MNDAGAWHQIISLVTSAVVEKSSAVLHHFEGETKFVLDLLERICQPSVPLVLKKDGLVYKMDVGRLFLSKPIHYDVTTNLCAPKFPHHAQWGESSYVATAKADLVFKVTSDPDLDQANATLDSLFDMRLDNGALPNRPRHPIVHYASAFTIHAGEIFVQLRGELCRIKGSGMLCHEDPDIQGAFHISRGAEKVTESQFVQRYNHCYVHFLNSSTSASQSTTAMDATRADSATVDSPVILQCDYRAADDDINRTYSAFHIFLAVDKPRYARQVMQKHMQQRKFDAEGHFVSSSISEPLTPRRLQVLTDMTQIGQVTMGLGENLTISFPNVDELNFNLVLVMFLLGFDDRSSMIQCIVPNEYHLLQKLGLINPDGSLSADCIQAAAGNALVHHAVLIYQQVHVALHNQSLFFASDTVDPRRIYYSQAVAGLDGDAFSERPGTYEYIVQNHTPFVGQDYGDYDEDRSSTLANHSEIPSADFVQNYHEATLDGWDRSAALAHVAKIILVHGSQKKKSRTAQEQPPQTHISAKYARDYGTSKQYLPKSKTLPDLAESEILHKAFLRFAKSFAEELLPHMGTTMHWRTIVAKRSMLGFMIRKTIMVFMGYQAPDQQDNMEMKRCEIPAQMMARVWGLSWQKSLNKMFRRIIGQVGSSVGKLGSRSINWQNIASSCFSMSPFADAMENGVWPRGGVTVMKVKGCTKRLLYANTLSYIKAMRSVHTITNEKGGSRMKDSPAQQVDNSHYQKFCPLGTANDKEAGIDLQFAIGSRIRIGYKRSELLSIVMQGAAEPESSKFFNHFTRLHDAPPAACARDGGVSHVPAGAVPVFINGSKVGYTFEPFKTMKALKLARRYNFFGFDVSITWINGPVGLSKTLRNPFYHYIHISGDWGAKLTPYIDMSQLYKLPTLVMEHSSAQGIFPNFTLAQCAALTGGGAYDSPHPVGDYNLSPGMLYDTLLNEGVIVYLDNEESSQECIATSFRDVATDLDWYIRNNDQTMHDSASCSVDWQKMNNLILETCQQNPATRQNLLQKNVKRFSYMTVSESFMLGFTASAIPFVNSDDACRASYTTGMTAQSTGAAPLNLAHKKNIYHMYLLEPKTSLAPMQHANLFSIVGASNAAIPSLTCFYSHGQNGEDGVLRARAPSGRYHVNRIYVRSSSGVDASMVGDSTSDTVCRFTNPSSNDRCLTLKSKDYTALASDGMPHIGAMVRPGAAMMGRIFPVGTAGAAFRDNSFVNSSRFTVCVEQTIRSHNVDGLTTQHVRSSATRVQMDGDKTSSQHGQKGAESVVHSVDLPYLRDRYGRGLKPHLFRPPHGVPSRTTEGESREMLHADVSISEGRNNTVYSWEEGLDLFNTLEKVAPNILDFALINPETGVPLKTSASVGVLDFRLMRHLARETFNSRSLGAVDPKTRQPTHGTKRVGGTREGPLEALNKISHGATDVIEQLLFTNSDPDFAHVCVKCGLLASSAAPQVLLYDARTMVGMQQSREDQRRANHFALQLANCQGGIFHSATTSQSTAPSGGWCNACKTGNNVYKIPMAKVTQQLVEYGYLAGQSWRLVTNMRPQLVCLPDSIACSSNAMEVDQIQSEFDLDFDQCTIRIPAKQDIFCDYVTESPPYSPGL